VRGVIKLLLILLLAVSAAGLVALAISRARAAAILVSCRNNLKALGLALQSYHDTFKHFPRGTAPETNLAPDRRLSWIIEVWPIFMEGGYATRWDKTQAWDAPANYPPRFGFKTFTEGGLVRYVDAEMTWEVKALLCPANPARTPAPLPSPTHYVGVAGIGGTAAELPLTDPRAGFFGYDRQLCVKDIRDGLATTLALMEAADGGPWPAGGLATVRGLVAGERPYLGEGGQFAAVHRGSDVFPLSQPVVTNAVFADAHVCRLTAAVSPQVLEALATVAGNEPVRFLDTE
jgi:hypothetical protein